MKTQGLRDNDLDSIWTPEVFGLHVDSTQVMLNSFSHGTDFALTRAVVPGHLMLSHECEDNIDLLYKDGYQPHVKFAGRTSTHRTPKTANILLTKQDLKEAAETSARRCRFARHELASETH